jgi:hypothetical protein
MTNIFTQGRELIDIIREKLVALFSRLFFEKEYVVASSPSTISELQQDFVAMPYDSVVDTFRKYFRIVQSEEFEAELIIQS